MNHEAATAGNSGEKEEPGNAAFDCGTEKIQYKLGVRPEPVFARHPNWHSFDGWHSSGDTLSNEALGDYNFTVPDIKPRTEDPPKLWVRWFGRRVAETTGDSKHDKEVRQKHLQSMKRILMTHLMVPISMRIFLVALCLSALGVAVKIYHKSKMFQPERLAQQPSTIMAICVNSIATVYLFYITWDESSSMPLGLRSPSDKMRLILLDTLFIIFSAANVALAFNTLFDPTWVCTSSAILPYEGSLCRHQRGLAALLFVLVLMWILSFAVSIFRVLSRTDDVVSRPC